MIQNETYEEHYADMRTFNAEDAAVDVHQLRLAMVKDLISHIQDKLERGLHENGPAVAILAEEIALIAHRPLREWAGD